MHTTREALTMTRTPLTRSVLTRAADLFRRAPEPRPLPAKTEPITGTPNATPSPALDAHLVAVGDRARRAHRKARR